MSKLQPRDVLPAVDGAEEVPPAQRLAAITGYGLASIQPDTLSRAAYRAGVSLIDARRLIACLMEEMGAV